MKRKTKSKIVIAVEGKNTTEKNYFSKYSKRGQTISFAPGNNTDIKGIFKNLCRYIDKNDIGIMHDDTIFLVVDIDNKMSSIEQLKDIQKESVKRGINIICSNACFEVWFLLHFEAITAYTTTPNLLKKLTKHIKNYDKSMDVFDFLKPNLPTAIENAKAAHKKALADNALATNSHTNVFEMVELLLLK